MQPGQLMQTAKGIFHSTWQHVEGVLKGVGVYLALCHCPAGPWLAGREQLFFASRVLPFFPDSLPHPTGIEE